MGLERQDYTLAATATTDGQGMYIFDGLGASDANCSVVFAQEWNATYGVDEVASWAWLGPVTARGGASVTLPDLEVGLPNLGQFEPQAGASVSSAGLSQQTPLTFEWTELSGEVAYWVDLARGEELAVVWQSPLVETPRVTWDGTLSDGSHVPPDTYWWGIGARRDLDGYEMTVYGYLTALFITP